MEEPWLRGAIAGVHPLAAPILFAFQQAREDLTKWSEGLSDEQLRAEPFGAGSIAFHLRHIAGSTGRLMTYLQGGSLNDQQMAELRDEKQAGGSREELLAELDAAFRRAEEIVRSLDPAALTDARTVGRKRLPTTVIGLLTHIAEHTARHVGEAIVVARAVRGGK
jgi:uncharacterized damage-inducible protein DinB